MNELGGFFANSAARIGDEDRDQSFLAILGGTYVDASFHWSYIFHFHWSTIAKLISSTTSNTVGSDGIPLKFIKLISLCILPVLEHIFNFSLQNGIFPTAWKSVTPQHYRPFSILPALSKVLEREREICKQICNYLEDADLRDPFQSAYRKHHSTQTCLVRMLDKVRQATDKRMVTVSVFFDFSKAFDKVDHLTRIRKLKKLNFSDSALSWIYSYLVSRTQSVRDRVAGTLSSSSSVVAGVPQGSVLGPLLFTLYLSNFRQVLRHCKYNFYADDLQIYLHHKSHSVHEAILRVNEDIQAVIDWSTTNNLSLNPDKTQAIIIGTSRYVNSIDLCSVLGIMVGTSTIHYTTSVQYLGITILNNLSWEKQVNITTKKIRSVLYRLKLCRHLFPAALRFRLVHTLILPYGLLLRCLY